MSAGGFTVIERIRDHRCEPTPELSWAIGAAVRDAYERQHGALPEKVLRPKTSGTGSHCFAWYPDSFRETADRIVRAHLEAAKAAGTAQGNLFERGDA